MNPTERLVKRNFLHQGYSDVVFEPDGNVPPDFLINDSIAVEVRRLNQNYDDGVKIRGLEEVSIPIWKNVEALLSTYENEAADESWFVHFKFSRPVEAWKELKPKLENALRYFLNSKNREVGVIASARNFELRILCRALKPHKSVFVLGGCFDENSGGVLVLEMQKNLVYCANQKERKIGRGRSKYQTWWLALVDHIGFGLDDFDQEQFKTKVFVEHSWEKILILNPWDFRQWFEI